MSFAFRGFEIPLPLLQRTGCGAEHFDVIAAQHRQAVAAYAPIEPHHHVLDMGSGIGRDALLLLDVLGERGRYTGFDVDRESIDWCNAQIAARHPNFRFHWLDVYSKVYNPQGALRGAEVRLPADDGSVDRALAYSLFTHLLEPEALHYLSELRRVLAPDGLGMLTFFVADEAEMPASLESPVPTFRFPHRWSDGVWVNDEHHPEGAVAVAPDRLQRWLDASGLRLVRPVVRGYWLPGRSDASAFGQDIAVVSPAT